MTMRFSALFHYPLLIFSLVGGFAFAMDSWIRGPDLAVIHLTATDIDGVVSEREQILGRQLTDDERQELIDALIDQEILVRAAIEQGVHLGDGFVRNRLIEKMNFLFTEEPPEPTSADLQAMMDADPDAFMTPPTVTLEQVYVHGTEIRAHLVNDQLQRNPDSWAELGDRYWLGNRLEYYSADQVIAVLGLEAWRTLDLLPTGQWTEPLAVGDAWHIVRVVAHHPPQPLGELALDLRLKQQWRTQHRIASRERELQRLRPLYRVVLDPQS